MQTASFRFDVMILGGGHNGLVAAAYLAAAGKRVLLLERNEVLGGATQSQRVFPDHDARLSSYAYLISLLPQQILDELRLDFKTKQRRIGSFTCYKDKQKRPQGLILSNTNEDVSRQSVEKLGGSKVWEGYQQFLALQTEFAKFVWPTLLDPLRSRADFQAKLSNERLRAAWQAYVEEPLGVAIEHYLRHDVLRGLVLTDAKIGVFTHPHDPRLLQNRCFLYHTIGQGDGQWRVPIGGMGALVKTLVDRCQQLGVQIQTGAAVTHIDPGSDEHTISVQLQDRQETYSAHHLLVTCGPRQLDNLLGRPSINREEDEGSVTKVNMLLRRLPKLKAEGFGTQFTLEDAFTGSFHVDEGYSQMRTSYRQASVFQIPKRPPFEVYCHTLTDPSILSPDLQQAGWHTMTLFGLDMPYRLFLENGWAVKHFTLMRYLKAMDAVCAESFTDCLATDRHGNPCIEIKSALDLEEELGLEQGNIFHNAPSWFYAEDDAAVGSWGVETDVPRLYFAGSAALRGGAVSGIPGRCAAMQVMQDLASV